MSSYDDLSAMLVEKFDVDPDAIRPEATLTDLGLDSLSMVELVFDIEDTYDIEIPEEQANLGTLGEAAALVDKLIGQRDD